MGHKRDCREPGQIEVGDDMQLHDSKHDFGLVFVKVLAPIEGATNLWKVKPYGSDEVLLVNSDELVHICPALV
jgi:hypothetical protein